MGQKLLSFVAGFEAPDAKTIRMTLKEPYGLVLQTLAKPGANVPFMMPKRVADTDPNQQITDFTGSGPFTFRNQDWKAGEKAVYVRNPKYRPRSDPPSGLAGAKVVKVDRVEWLWIADTQTQIDALTKGEIDYIEAPPHDLLPLLQKDPNVELLATNPYGRQYAFRFNTLHKPFDNPKIRQAVAYALNGKDFLDASIGDPKWYRECKSLFPCGSPLESTAGWDDKLSGNAAKAKQLLQEAGYDGTPIVLMQQTDIAVLKDFRAGRKAAPGEGRIQGRPAVDGLADAGLAPGEEGPAVGRRLARLRHDLVVGRGPRPCLDELPQRELRQGDLRLAVRRRDRAAARRLRQGNRSGKAEGDRRSGAAPRRRGADARSSRPIRRPGGVPEEPLGRAGGPEHQLLEHREAMSKASRAHLSRRERSSRAGRRDRVRGEPSPDRAQPLTRSAAPTRPLPPGEVERKRC